MRAGGERRREERDDDGELASTNLHLPGSTGYASLTPLELALLGSALF